MSAIRQGRAGCTWGSLPTDAGIWGLPEEELRQGLIRDCSGVGVGGGVPGRENLVSRIIPGVTGNHEETARLAQGALWGQRDKSWSAR